MMTPAPFSGVTWSVSRRHCDSGGYHDDSNPRADGHRSLAPPAPLLTGLTAAFALASISPAAAHGFGQRYDLPLPLYLWVWGAGLSIVLSFVIVAAFVGQRQRSAGYPRFNLLRIGFFRVLGGPVVLDVLRTLVALLFLLTLAAGLFGSQDAVRNLIVPMIWVVWWVGVAFVCALIGNIWAVVNPLRTLFTWGEGLWAAVVGAPPPPRPYPAWLGYWPAVVFFVMFAWAELVWPGNNTPTLLAMAVITYSIVAWIGMSVFGREKWLERADAFTVAFGVLGRFAPLGRSESRDGGHRVPPMSAGETAAATTYDEGAWELRPPGAALLGDERVHWTLLIFVLTMLSTVTYDGFLETPAFRSLSNWVVAVFDPNLTGRLLGIETSVVVKTATLVVFPCAFVLAFMFASWLMRRAAKWVDGNNGRGPAEPGTLEIACRFVFTLVPIAVAYHLAHYSSLLVTAGQFAIPLASDPFGWGWDLFGTASYQVQIGKISPFAFWYSAVVAIIVGHVIAVYLAHVVALRVFPTSRSALASQVPMVALMVVYTMTSLWILAQPIVGH